ncbi:MAG: amino acid ABC transporter substrate-binding protein [Desulfobacteraceae bacterium 4572_88]|nr:MAG: amino acid ABC transporter substrate-binding protein [Desulfobacteraceae bacterium 4572_88]
MTSNLKCSFIAATLLIVLLGSGVAIADVKIGFLGGFTGPLKSMTPAVHKAAKLAVKHVNQQGGVLDGQNIIIPNADTTCSDITAAAAAATRLVNDEKVVALIGALCSGATIAVANQVAIPGGITMVSPASSSPAITTLDDADLVFRSSPSDVYQGSVMARLLLSKGIRHIAITYVDNDWGRGMAGALSGAFTAGGGKIAGSQAHEEGKADYRAHIRSLATSGVDTLVVLAYANGSGQVVIRQAIETGDFDRFVGGDGMVSNTLIAAIGSDKLRGMIATKPGRPDTRGAREFNRLAWRANLNPAAIFAAQSYDAAFLLALAIEKNGQAERAGLSKTLRAVASPPGEVILPGEWQKAKTLLKAGKDINYEGAVGSLDFDQAGDVSGVIVEMGINVREGSFIEFGQVR